MKRPKVKNEKKKHKDSKVLTLVKFKIIGYIQKQQSSRIKHHHKHLAKYILWYQLVYYTSCSIVEPNKF